MILKGGTHRRLVNWTVVSTADACQTESWRSRHTGCVGAADGWSCRVSNHVVRAVEVTLGAALGWQVPCCAVDAPRLLIFLSTPEPMPASLLRLCVAVSVA